MRMARDEAADYTVENRSGTVVPWIVLTGDDSQLLQCKVLAGSSYGRGARWRTNLGRSRVAWSTRTWRATTRSFSKSSTMLTRRPKGWNEPGLAQTGDERHP
jgi:hypothetical protein